MRELTDAQIEELGQLGDWVLQTCLVWGATRATAHLVAGEFVKGVVRAWAYRALAKAKPVAGRVTI